VAVDELIIGQSAWGPDWWDLVLKFRRKFLDLQKILTRSSEDGAMPSFQHFQNQAAQKSPTSKFPNEVLSLSVVLQYAETAKKQSFEALCRIQPLVKTYRDKVDQTSQAMIQASSKLGEEVEVPAAYTAALSLVKESFAVHLAALEEWMSAFAQKNESHSEKAMATVQKSGEQLGSALDRLSSGPRN
jgi:hypothetical protein